MNQLQHSDLQRGDGEARRGDAAEAPPERSMTAGDLARIFRRHLWLVALMLAVSTATAALISKHTPKVWRATAEMLLVQRAPMMAATSQEVANAPMVESVDTQVTLLQSRGLAQEAARQVGISPEALQNASSISLQKEGDNVIDLAVEADSRQHATDWANALCQTFVRYKKQVAQHNSQGTVANLKGQRAQARADMAATDSQLLKFEKTHVLSGIGVLDAPVQQTAALKAVLDQDTIVAGYRNDYATARSRAASLQSQLQQVNRAIKNGTGVRDNDEVVKLQEQLHQLQEQRRVYAEKYKPNFPGVGDQPSMKSLDDQIADDQARLNFAIQAVQSQPSLQAQGVLNDAYDSARTDAASAGAKLAAAIQQRHELQQETVNLPQISLEADRLTQNRDQAHALYNSLNERVRTAQLDTDVASGNVQIVQQAFAPADPIRPSHKRDLLVGLGVGLFLSLVAVLLLEQANHAVRTAAEIRRLVEGPVVAVLPQMTRAQRAQLARGENPPQLIEVYNAARANLSLALRPGLMGLASHQIILVSSTVAGEGKSLTASELAQSFARAGRRVILVNADMRRPSSLPLLRPAKEAAPGLAEVLAGEVPLGDALFGTEVHNLSVLRSGVPNRNPIDLISQPQMAETIRALRDNADVVIIDSPPAGVVADALLLAPYADCVLYVVGVGMVDSDGIRNTAATLAAAAPKVLSYFVNRAPQSDTAQRPSHEYNRDYQAPSLTNEAGGYESSRTIMMEPYRPAENGARPGGAHSENGARPDHSPFTEDAPLTEAAQTALAEANPSEPDDGTSVNRTGVFTRVRVLPSVGSHLAALVGPYVGQRFALSPDRPLMLGILPDNDIVLARDSTISRRHAHISHEPGGYVVYDDNSTNGTFVNDVQIARQALLPGDVIQFGASRFRYE